MAQSCLEILSMNERHEEIVRSDYNYENKYDGLHPDALATGDAQGKGTGGGQAAPWLPDCSSYMGTSTFRYDDFDTAVSSNAGNNADNEARNKSFVRSLYSAEAPYSEVKIDTSANIREGQFSLA